MTNQNTDTVQIQRIMARLQRVKAPTSKAIFHISASDISAHFASKLAIASLTSSKYSSLTLGCVIHALECASVRAALGKTS